MATQGQAVTGAAWVNIVSTLSLVVGTIYTLQNVGATNVHVKLIEAATEPADSDPAHILKQLDMIPATPATGLGLWVKCDLAGADVAASVIAVTEG
jgi:hypothetical protein